MTSPHLPDSDLTAEEREQVERSRQRLAQEFAGVFGTETIAWSLASSRHELTRRAMVTTWLPVLIERLTRDRLRAIARTDLGHVERPAVLFMCTHNAGRSQMAAGWMRRLADDRIEVFTAGTQPGTSLDPTVVAAMAEVGIDLSDELPQPWIDEVALAADVIVTMGCGDACPVFPGKRYEDWDLPSPSGSSIEEVRELRNAVQARVEQLRDSLVPSMAGGVQ